MDEIRSGRSLAKPRKTVRSEHVARSYAKLHRWLLCEFCREEQHSGEGRAPTIGSETHHAIGGGRREDADWNLLWLCASHHRHEVWGFHGSRPLWDHARAFELKRSQGYELPPEAWAFLPEGRDACPTPEPDQRRNRELTRKLVWELRG